MNGASQRRCLREVESDENSAGRTKVIVPETRERRGRDGGAGEGGGAHGSWLQACVACRVRGRVPPELAPLSSWYLTGV